MGETTSAAPDSPDLAQGRSGQGAGSPAPLNGARDAQSPTSAGTDGSTSDKSNQPSAVSNQAAPPSKITGSRPQSFTQADVAKAVSDALAKAGRDAKALEAREKALTEAEAASLTELRKQPEELSLLQRKQVLMRDINRFNERVRAHEAREAELEKRLKRAEAAEFALAVADIARRHDVEAEALTDTGVTDLAQLERVAAMLPRSKHGVRPDSGESAGGLDVSAMSARDKIAAGLRRKY